MKAVSTAHKACAARQPRAAAFSCSIHKQLRFPLLSSLAPACKATTEQGAQQQVSFASSSTDVPASIVSDVCKGSLTLHQAQLLAACPLVVVGLLALSADPALADQLQEAASKPQELFNLAEDAGFWQNVGRYARYFVTVMLGTGYVMMRPILGLFKNPLTAVLGIAGIAGSVVLLKLTIDAMLGLSEPFSYDSGPLSY